MSVINTMLQDLDARAGRAPLAPAPLPAQALPALALGARPLRQRLLLIALAGVLAVATWPAGAPSSPSSPASTAATAARPAAPKTIVLAPVSVAAPAPQAPERAAAPPVPPVPSAAPAPTLTAAASPAAPAPAPAPAPGPAPASASARPLAAAAAVRPAPLDPAGGVVQGSGSVGSPYRRALDHLAGGRKAAAIGELEQALQARPRDLAARETLVGLLLDGGRTSEAVAQLQAALALEPRHPAMAMLLARLQIDGGGDGIDTLLRTLPAVEVGEVGEAGEAAAYHALLAGALQRRGRHHEAVPHYQAALQTAPDHGLWLLGLGLSLRADGRSADAIAAFRRANAAGDLTPELAAFVAAQLPAQR